jgi:hypothetical protein
MRDALARVQAAVARHPRLLMTLLLIGLLVVSADPVAAADGASGGELLIDRLFDSELTSDGAVTVEDPVNGGDGPTNP